MRSEHKAAVRGIRGRRVGPEPENEAEHFFICNECGQAVDMRSLAQVFHYEERGHKPMTEAELSEDAR